ncbi:MAG: deoxyribodipyrimidine photo-lyase [Phycisphaerales bacterium]
MRPLVWFRTDLRLHDHAALAAAAAAEERGMVAVFVLCPGQWAEHDLADIRVDFVRRTLGVLSADLAARNIALRILTVDGYADVPDALADLAAAEDCDAVWFNAAYEVNEAQRDAAVRAAFGRHGRGVHTFHDQCIVEPGTVRTGTGGPYTVFTPFKKNLLGRLRDGGLPAVQPAPAKRDAMVGRPDPIPADIEGYPAPPAAMVECWPAGEAEALRRLDAFAAQRMGGYKDTRDLAADDTTSRLSPHLAIGTISVRHCLEVAAEANDGQLLDGREGIATWISELVWRDFYRHVMVAFPRVSMHRAFKEKTEALAWRDDAGEFQAWCEGRTGYPIVDAGMRQLLAEGWMHNRLRMITAMFLTKDLYIDWRMGERHFMRHLIDGDLASNNGGWQWSASTGTDAQPYFRIFNPITQGQRFDADGTYIRRWVPELADLKGKAIHEPWKRDGLFEQRDGYPRPIVDHSAARDRVLTAFKALP